MSYSPLPDTALRRPTAWRALLLWALLTSLAVAGFAALRALEGDANVVQAPATQGRHA